MSFSCPACESVFVCSTALKCHLEGQHGYTVLANGSLVEQDNKRGIEDDRELGPKISKSIRVTNSPSPEVKTNESQEHDALEEKMKVAFTHLNNDSHSPLVPPSDSCQPSRFSKDPLRGFFLQTVMECQACQQRPTKKFSTQNAWLLHIKTFHKQIKSILEYKSLHGDPDLVKFRHKCRECGLNLALHLGVVKRHLRAQHQMTTSSYLTKHRRELEEERKGRPVVPPMHTLDGWWEGCLYCCGICGHTYGGQLAFENHLSSVHGLVGQEEVEKKYVSKHGRPRSLLRQHLCYVCGRQIRHDYKTIFTHLTKHKMDLESYAVQFRSLLEAELKEKGMGYILERAKRSEGALTVDQWLLKQPKRSFIDPLEGWADCSEHLCKLCGEISWSNLRFHWHVKRQHGIGSTKEYRRLHGDPERWLRQHKCQLCGNMIKWEASRIRDHLKFHREAKDKLSIKAYGEKFRDYILEELGKVKGPVHIPLEVEQEKTFESVDRDVDIDDSPEKDREDVKEKVYSAEEWRALHKKKVTPRDRVTCDLCNKTMNRHSFTRHKEKAHQGIFNVRDLERLKRKQAGLAKSGVVRTLEQLVAGAGGKVVMRGKGEDKVEVDIKREEVESGLHLYRAGLSINDIEKKVDLLHAGLTITKAMSAQAGVEERVEEGVCETQEEDYPTYIVDEDTGEILFVEEVGLHEKEEHEQEQVSLNHEEIMTEDLGEDIETIVQGGDKEKEYESIATLTYDGGGVREVVREVDDTEEEEDQGDEYEDTGPLDGRVMQLVPHGDEGGEVTIIELGREEEEVALEEEMLEAELQHEYILAGGELKDTGENQTWQNEGILGKEDSHGVAEERPAEEYVIHSMEHGGFMVQEEQQPPFIVLHDVSKEQVTETSQYIQLVDRKEEEERKSRPWVELGGGGEYARKVISKAILEIGDRVSQGTVIAPWTKMPDSRVRVAHSKVIIPSASSEGGQVTDEQVANPLVYSRDGRLWRDIGSQVAPHRVSGQPSSTEEEIGETRRVEDFLARGGQLDRSCPGCGKVMSRQRNLVTHLKVIHGVSLTGKEEEHDVRYSKENIKLKCSVCEKRVSRKSLKRHMSLCHPEVLHGHTKLEKLSLPIK